MKWTIETSPQYPGVAVSRFVDPSKEWTANDRALVSAVRILAVCLFALIVLTLAPVTTEVLDKYPFVIGFLLIPIIHFVVRSIRLFIKQVASERGSNDEKY